MPCLLLGAHPEGVSRKRRGGLCCFSTFRPVPFKVADCTDFSNKTVPTRQQMENIALIIPTKPARKRAGFKGAGFTGESQGEETEDEELASATE